MHKIFDSHGHLNLSPLADSWQEYWQQANQHGVEGIFVPGTNINSSKYAIKIAKSGQGILAGAGIHPSEAENIDVSDQLNKLRKLVELNQENLLGIGETGLDYYWLKDDENRAAVIEGQKLLFEGQLKIAAEFNLPVSIHVRDKQAPEIPGLNNAYWDTLAIITPYVSQLTWVLHCASGPVSYIKQALEMGAYVGFAGNITYPNAENIRALAELVPNDKLLLETDAPYLPPQDFRGKICEPWMIAKTAEFLTEYKTVSYKELQDNALRVFNLL